MEFRNLVTFVRAAELHSFSQAARQLGYSQSAISMQISQLEAELNTSLFDRVGKTIALTPQGLRFFEYAQNILRMAESAREEMKNAAAISGHLRIAMAESICMSLFPPVLSRFCALYPEVRLTVQTGTTAEEFCMAEGYAVNSYAANTDAETALLSGKVDAWVIDDLTAAEMVKIQNAGDGQKLVILSEAMTAEPYAIGFCKGSESLVAAVSEIIEALVADGTVQAIFEKYDAPYTAPQS